MGVELLLEGNYDTLEISISLLPNVISHLSRKTERERRNGGGGGEQRGKGKQIIATTTTIIIPLILWEKSRKLICPPSNI